MPRWLGRGDVPRSDAPAPRATTEQHDDADAPPPPTLTLTDAGGDAPSRRASRPTMPTNETDAADVDVEHNSIARYLSQRAHPMGDHGVSPYNEGNPFFGYPASLVDMDTSGGEDVPQRADDATAVTRQPQGLRQLRVKRRKRDLLRTLAYLFMLRVLDKYREARRSLKALVWVLRGPRASSRPRSREGTPRTMRGMLHALLGSQPLTWITLGVGLLLMQDLSRPRVDASAQQQTWLARVLRSRGNGSLVA